MSTLNEDVIELAALEWFAALGYEWYTETDWASGAAPVERSDYNEVILPDRLQAALARLGSGSSRAVGVDQKLPIMTAKYGRETRGCE